MGASEMKSNSFYAALCGKDASKPLYEHQSPQILTLFDPERESMESTAQAYRETHRFFIIARMFEPAAMDYLASRILYPNNPVSLDMFLFWDGIPYEMKPEFLTLDYCGA
jgi:hypothetical protein